jgi:GT2 family glycosyltransferase
MPIQTNADKDSQDDYQLIGKSYYFDAEYYRRNCPDLHDQDPIEHYLRFGDQYNPSANFDGLAYLEANDDVRNQHLNPLVHYLRHGRAEGRRVSAFDPWRRQTVRNAVPSPAAPTGDEWLELEDAIGTEPGLPVVDVIVPVYRNLDETLRCLHSVRKARQATPYRLIVVDDCSPEPELSAALRRLADRGLFELLRLDENCGFVGACNLAMSLHADRDVVLLNSDTEVFGDWLDRLRTAALAADRIGTVTPLSNNAEICSYPRFIKNNGDALELSDQELDAIAATVNSGKAIEIPTGVGFCFYARRECLDEIGLFDEQNFGKGYGEENDLCLRAASAGWSNVLAANVFVRHYGGSSFGASKDARMRDALATMERLHPGYGELVGAFLKDDPVRPAREALDVGRVRRMATLSGRRTVLYVTHSWGGGTERHVQEMTKLALAEGAVVLIGRVDERAADIIRLEVRADTDFPNLPSLGLADGVEAAAATLQALGVSHVHIQHLAGFDPQVSDFLRTACGLAGMAYDVTLHDYMAICPRITLIDGTGRYCGEPSEVQCEACVQRYHSPFGQPFVWSWRARYERLLGGARRIFVPSADQARRLARFLPQLEFVVRPHPEPANESPPLQPPATLAKGRARRVALLGVIGPQKGLDLLIEVSKAAQAKGLPLEFVVIGYSDRDEDLKALGVQITGAYQGGQAAELLRATNVDLVWFASVSPETYSYTLGEAFRAGVMPVAFDFGAVAERIRSSGWGCLMPLKMMLSPEAVAQALADTPLQPPPPGGEVQVSYPDLFWSYYDLDPPPRP